MKRSVSYEGLSDATKHAKAIEDIKQYLGDSVYHKVIAALCSYPTSDKEFVLNSVEMMLGIEGYPLEALWNETHA